MATALSFLLAVSGLELLPVGVLPVGVLPVSLDLASLVTRIGDRGLKSSSSSIASLTVESLMAAKAATEAVRLLTFFLRLPTGCSSSVSGVPAGVRSEAVAGPVVAGAVPALLLLRLAGGAGAGFSAFLALNESLASSLASKSKDSSKDSFLLFLTRCNFRPRLP